MKRSEPGVKVYIRAEPATEIFLLDHQFRLRERGVGRLTATVEPGLYKVKYRAGTEVVETHVEIEPKSGTVHLQAPVVPYFSPAPLATAQTTHEYHEDAAATLSRKVHQHLGEGSQLFFFARAWTHPQGRQPRVPPVPSNHHPATGLTLRSADGSLLVDLQQASEVRLDDDPWAGCTVSVAPGAYRLRVDTPRWGGLEQTVIASPGWQTQVFLLQDNFSDTTASAYRPDLAEGSILLARVGHGFDPKRGELRLAELARQSLASNRAVLSADDLTRLVTKKRSSPMLGIYGAHALLARGARRQISATTRVLSSILGDHPDVNALRLAMASRPSNTLSFALPPMLSASWSIIVDRAAKRPDLVPAGSLSSRVASCLWGNGPWLIWLAEQVAETSTGTSSATVADALAAVSELGSRFPADQSSIADRLTDLEAALFSAIVPQPRNPRARSAADIFEFNNVFEAEPANETQEAAATVDVSGALLQPPAAEAAGALSAIDIGKALGLPPSSLHAAADELSRKLSEL